MGLDINFIKRRSESIGYFRKVNFLVKFFQDKGMDVNNQQLFLINKEMIEDLHNRCLQVINDHSKAEQLLPTMSGFFFGSTEYDEYYFEDVQQVCDYIENNLLEAFDSLDNEEDIYFDIWY